MEETRRNTLVGIFVLMGLLALGALIVLFGRGPTWLVRGDTYPLHVIFPQVTGIRAGTLVTIKGITVGRVEDVRLLVEPDQAVGESVRVDVRLAVENRYRLPEGTTARTSEPVLGQGRPPIELEPGPESGSLLKAGAEIDGKIIAAIETIFPADVVGSFKVTSRQIGDAAEALTPVLQELRRMLEQRSPAEVDVGGLQGNLSSAMARLDGALKHFNDVLGDVEVKSQVRETVANVREMSERGKTVMEDLEAAAGETREVVADARKFVEKADGVLVNVDGRVTKLAEATTGTLDRADQLLDNMNAISGQIREGRGNVGRLVMDDKLYEAMVLTAERLSVAVEEFRALIAEWREGKVRVAL